MKGSAVRTTAVAVCLAVGLLHVSVVTQESRPAGTTSSGSTLQVRAQPDGRLFVSATDIPVDEVIAAVAAAAGLRLRVAGATPRDRVTVLFPHAFADEILAAVMDPAGISYILAAGRGSPGGRLVMGKLRSDARSVSQLAGAEPTNVPKQTHVAEAGSQLAAPVTAEVAAERPAGADPTEWPAGVEPVNSGAPPDAPQTREALFLQVNGSLSTTMTAETPNLRTLRPEEVEPVNPVPPAMNSRIPGVATAPNAVSSPTGGTMAPAPEMLRPPQTIAIPGPVVVTFPPPKQP